MLRALFFALSAATPAVSQDMSLSALQDRIVGRWSSIACELRPTAGEGGVTPTYLIRDFTYDAKSGFAATITVYADAACAVPAISYDFAGEIVWHGPNPAAEGAWSQHYVLNRQLALSVHAEPMLAQLNALPDGACGAGAFELGQVREDTPNMLFMGGKHVDGTGFYFPENGPRVGLQQPLIRVE